MEAQPKTVRMTLEDTLRDKKMEVDLHADLRMRLHSFLGIHLNFSKSTRNLCM